MGVKIFFFVIFSFCTKLAHLVLLNEHGSGGPHQHGTRNHQSIRSDVKDQVLNGYDKSMNPDHKVEVTMGMNLEDVHLCGHKEVNCLNRTWLQLNYFINERMIHYVIVYSTYFRR